MQYIVEDLRRGLKYSKNLILEEKYRSWVKRDSMIERKNKIYYDAP